MTKETTICAVDTSLDTALLKALSIRSNFETYYHYVDMKRVLVNTSVLLLDYEKYFELYTTHEEIDFNEFYTQFSQYWHISDLSEHDVKYYKDYVFPAILSCSLESVDKILIGFIEKQHKENITKCLKDGINTDKLRNIILDYERSVNKFNTSEDKFAYTIANTDFNVLDKSEGIPWFLQSLQAGLMSLTMGQYVLVSADKDTGKSAFVISEAVHAFKFLCKRNATNPILYFNSEGTAADVECRFLSCLYKDKVREGFEEIYERIDEIKQKFLSAFNNELFIVFQIAEISTFEALRATVEKYKPSLVIIDICDKLAKDEDPQSLKKLHDNLRVLSGVTCPVLGTTQAGDTTYYDEEKGKFVKQKWLGDNKTYGSKTGKGGAADTMIMIGQDGESNLRYINVTKKKRGRYVRAVCELQSQYSYYKEVNY